MANEIDVTFALEVANGNFADVVESTTLEITQGTVGGGGPGVVSCPTTEADLSLPNITTLGWCYMKNLDSSNYITHGPASGGVMQPYHRLKATEFEWFRFEPGVTPRWKANTAACKVLVKVYEN